MKEKSVKEVAGKTDFKWEQIYADGNQINRYPFDVVVSTVFSLFKRTKEPGKIHVLDLGCGCGNNTWFLCAEGFTVTAIDGSGTALDIAQKRLEYEGLAHRCTFSQQFFEDLVLPDKTFDLVIDRGSVSQTTPAIMQSVYHKVFQSMKPQAYFFSQSFAEECTGRLAGKLMPDGSYDNFKSGYFVNTGRTTFLNHQQLKEVFTDFEIVSISHVADTNKTSGDCTAVWNVLARKP